MSAMSVQGVGSQQAVQSGTEQSSDQTAELLARLRQDDDDPDIVEMIRDAQKKAEAQRDALKVTKNARYGDAPLEAYARLSRAKTRAQVNSASGYARQKIAQLKAALHSDSDNAIQIKGSIRQLEKAIHRGERKKRDLDRERLIALRKKRSEAQKKREELELQRRRVQRSIRESGYMQEAVISNRLASQLTATQMELRQQMQQLASAAGASAEAAAQQYTATADAAISAAAPAAPAALSLEG